MCYNPFSLQSLRILITGAASGIGRRTAIECSKLGASLILVDINEEKLIQLMSELDSSEREHNYFVVDLSNEREIDNLANTIETIDGLVNNAGIGGKKLPIKSVTRTEVEKVLPINSLAAVSITQSLLKYKKINRNGSIVFTASIAGYSISNPGNTIYAMSKNIINSYSDGAALELAVRNIRCNTVNPGSVNTPLVTNSVISNEERERDRNIYPLKRYGEPEDIAYAIIFLLSKASSWITGTHLIVDGGRSLV